MCSTFGGVSYQLLVLEQLAGVQVLPGWTKLYSSHPTGKIQRAKCLADICLVGTDLNEHESF